MAGPPGAAREPSEVTVLEAVEMLDSKPGAGAAPILADASDAGASIYYV